MRYTSTRDQSLAVLSAEAIAKGISADGGLFVPEFTPQVSSDFIEELASLDYIGRAVRVLSLFLSDFSEEELAEYAKGAYGGGKFSHEKTVPLVKLGERTHVLELWRGPTCAFKDMALQILPYLLTGSVKKAGIGQEIVILVATSGDTGKAALEGFCDVAGTRILVFYPSEGVSPMQKLQMTTQKGENVGVCGIAGNFDDAQTGVKQIFTDEKIKAVFNENNFSFSSANSINWGRLVPQIVYYFSAYCDLLGEGKIQNGDKVNFVVPTGNFGNILAAYFAKHMGLPVNKLICASNANNVLTDFMKTGTYDRNRQFFATASPSMDILISSNLERLLFLMNGGNAAEIREWFASLAKTGSYAVNGGVLSLLQSEFAAGYCDDAATKETIKNTFEKNGYLLDTHTAVAVRVYEDYVKETGDKTVSVIASTASPYKFCADVLDAVKGGAVQAKDDFSMLKELEAFTGVAAPQQLKALKGQQPRFSQVCEKEDMQGVVLGMLGLI
ncbi:MAG: threonine synthase [Oscillospiraceae bacterium]|jgi:threonine synthase|nr:threonine synthase [Oscillospiraceae bacterium]